MLKITGSCIVQSVVKKKTSEIAKSKGGFSVGGMHPIFSPALRKEFLMHFQSPDYCTVHWLKSTVMFPLHTGSRRLSYIVMFPLH